MIRSSSSTSRRGLWGVLAWIMRVVARGRWSVVSRNLLCWPLGTRHWPLSDTLHFGNTEVALMMHRPTRVMLASDGARFLKAAWGSDTMQMAEGETIWLSDPIAPARTIAVPHAHVIGRGDGDRTVRLNYARRSPQGDQVGRVSRRDDACRRRAARQGRPRGVHRAERRRRQRFSG